MKDLSSSETVDEIPNVWGSINRKKSGLKAKRITKRFGKLFANPKRFKKSLKKLKKAVDFSLG